MTYKKEEKEKKMQPKEKNIFSFGCIIFNKTV